MYLKFAILTGCLRIAKESIYTGINNFACYGIQDDTFSDGFGLTRDEVDKLLQETNLAHKMSEIKSWYDGYRFGSNQEIYCPWDVLYYVKLLLANPNTQPDTFWKNTSTNVLVKNALIDSNENVRNKYRLLVDGGGIQVPVSQDFTYDQLNSRKEYLWNLLYLTGYLTKASPEKAALCCPQKEDGTECLVIPNKEVLEIYKDSIKDWTDVRRVQFETSFFKSFLEGNSDKVSEILTNFLVQTASFHDYGRDPELFYHTMMAVLFSCSGDWDVLSNRESGSGRPDLILSMNNRAAVIEIKRCSNPEKLREMLKKGLAQIENNNYHATLCKSCNIVDLWCFSFSRKQCLAACRRIPAE